MHITPLVSSTFPSTHAESFGLISSTVPGPFWMCLLDNLFGHCVYPNKSAYFLYISQNFTLISLVLIAVVVVEVVIKTLYAPGHNL